MKYPPPSQPSQPSPWQPWQTPPNPSMLASQSERERAVDVLRAAFGEGRLQQGEFEQRVARAYAARTLGDLSVLVADLPQGPLPMPPAAMAPAPAFPQPYLPYPPYRPRNGKAVAAMVLGLVSLVTCGFTGIPALVLGHLALGEVHRTGARGHSEAVAGVTLGWLSVGWWVLLFMLFVG